MKYSSVWAKECARLAKGHEHEIGWLPDTIYAPALAEGRLIVEGEGLDCEAFCLFGKPRPEMKIFQTLVDYGSQREYIGTIMIEQVISRALENLCERLTLHCAIDLEANRFWGALGFSPVGVRRAATLSRRNCMKWEIEFPRGAELEQMVCERLKKSKVKDVAAMFGVENVLKERLRKQFRRKYFGGIS